MNPNFLNVPEELQLLNKWVCWNYVENNGKKTKIPINPITKSWAKKNDPSTWCTFNDAVSHSASYDGIGFMITSDDPYIFVDFDETDDPEIIANQQFYFQQLNSYSELSPSGKGLHIIVRGELQVGRRRNKIEVYPYSFMTVTGNVYHNVPIRQAQTLVEQLWETLEGVATNPELAKHNVTATQEDAEIYNLAATAKNSELFLDLWNGNWQKHDSTGQKQSAADLKLVNILAFYTQDRGQVARMFRSSALGQRPKAKRPDYMQAMITKAFDNVIPKIDFSQLICNMNLQPLAPVEQVRAKVAVLPNVIQPTQAVSSVPNVSIDQSSEFAYSKPPGLVGDLADFIYQQAWKPVKQISVVGALGLMAGLAGRSYNVSGMGLNLYLLMLAKTGRGKEAIAKGYEKIFNAITPMMPTIRDFKGPGDLASGQALLRYMSEHQNKSFVSVFGEFGPMLKRITSPTAIGADLMTQKVMLDFYAKSGKSARVDPTAYSDAERNTKSIQSHAFIVVAECAPKWFDILANEGMIETGLLPRFIIAQYDGIRVPSNTLGPSVYPNQSLCEQLMGLTTQSLQNMRVGEPYQVPVDDYATRLSSNLDAECDDIVNEAKEDLIVELWNRVHLNTIKVAGIIAVGIDPYKPVIDRVAFEWAETFIKFNINKLLHKFDDDQIIRNFGDSESEEIKKVELVSAEYLIRSVAELKSYQVPPKLHALKVIPWSYFSRRLTRLKPFSESKIGAANAIKRAVSNLIDNGDLQEISKAQAIKDFDFHGRCFAVRSTKIAQLAGSVK